MMKKLVMVLALLVVSSCLSFAGTATLDTYAEFNLVAAPLVPFDPAPTSVFNGIGLDYYGSTLNRFDAPRQQMIDYNPYDSTNGFGNILLGDGYWLYCDGAYSITYTGVDNGVPDAAGNKTDMWISLPGDQNDGKDAGGWNLIGNPFNSDIPFGTDEWSGLGDNILVTDGSTVKTIAQADADGWLNGTFQYFQADGQSMKNAGFFYADDYYLRAGKGYWVYTNKDNLALIIPAPAE